MLYRVAQIQLSMLPLPRPPLSPPLSLPLGSGRTLPLRAQHFTHASGRTDRQTNGQTDRHAAFSLKFAGQCRLFFCYFFDAGQPANNRHLAPFPAGSHPLLVLVSADVITLKKCDRIPGSKQWRAMRDSHRAGTSESGGGQWTLLLGLRLEKLAMVTVLPVLQNAE